MNETEERVEGISLIKATGIQHSGPVVAHRGLNNDHYFGILRESYSTI